MHNDLISVILFDDLEKGKQYRLSISEFRGVNYISIREWYLGFEGAWLPTPQGVTIPYNLHSTSRLFKGLESILSDAETLSQVKTGKVDMAELNSMHMLSETMKILGMTSDEMLDIVEVDELNRTVTIGVKDVKN